MPAPTPTAPIWQRQSGETPAAFRAFDAYRNLGTGRTLIATYRHVKGKPEARQTPGVWNGWAAANAWKTRAQAWDDHLDALVFARLETQQVERIARMRANAIQLSEANMIAAIRLLEIAGHDLAAWEAKMQRHRETNPEDPLMTPRDLAALVRAASAAAQAALDAQAAELGIEELMDALGLTEDGPITPFA